MGISRADITKRVNKLFHEKFCLEKAFIKPDTDIYEVFGFSVLDEKELKTYLKAEFSIKIRKRELDFEELTIQQICDFVDKKLK